MTREWDQWVGREEHRTDRLDPALAERFRATFDLSAPISGPLPQGIHFCLCTPEAPTRQLAEDGHPNSPDSDAALLPPRSRARSRRMWAGSSIVFSRPIIVGDAIERTSRIVSITEKAGGTGPLTFVEIDHATIASGVLAVTERQTLVFREAAAADAALSPPQSTTRAFDPAAWDAHRAVAPDPRLLFRYSALTFNSHRIHYDLPYARDVERYRGLVVHGPLTATLLLQLAAAQFGDNRLARFNFRSLGPAIAGEPLHLVMRGAGDHLEMAAFAGDGRQVTRAEAALG